MSSVIYILTLFMFCHYLTLGGSVAGQLMVKKQQSNQFIYVSDHALKMILWMHVLL